MVPFPNLALRSPGYHMIQRPPGAVRLTENPLTGTTYQTYMDPAERNLHHFADEPIMLPENYEALMTTVLRQINKQKYTFAHQDRPSPRFTTDLKTYISTIFSKNTTEPILVREVQQLQCQGSSVVYVLTLFNPKRYIASKMYVTQNTITGILQFIKFQPDRRDGTVLTRRPNQPSPPNPLTWRKLNRLPVARFNSQGLPVGEGQPHVDLEHITVPDCLKSLA